MSHRDFVSYAGPGDRDLPMSEVSGYQPVSRIGEVVMNAFIDSYEYAALADTLNGNEMSGNGALAGHAGETAEYKPMFHEWATAQPGMICLARKKKTAVFRQYVAAETAVPVIACAACLPKEAEKDYFFAGVCRSKTVRSPDDGIGPSVDEFFTVSIGGMVCTVLSSLRVAPALQTCARPARAGHVPQHVRGAAAPGRPRRVVPVSAQAQRSYTWPEQEAEDRPSTGGHQDGERELATHHRPCALVRQTRRDARHLAEAVSARRVAVAWVGRGWWCALERVIQKN